MKRQHDAVADEAFTSRKELRANSIRANDIIDLIFIGAEGVMTTVHPEYTHQIFAEESLSISNTNQLPRIEIFISCCEQLKHIVKLTTGSLDSNEVHHIQQSLTNALPINTEIICNDDAVATASSCQSTALPVGKLIDTLTCNDRQFEVYLATSTDNEAVDLLHRAEYIAKWFIETADAIDFTDHRWETIFIYESISMKESDQKEKHIFVGFFTLFSFQNPLKGTRIRICTACILPSHQGIGIGREVMLCIYRLIKQRADVTEITVEDPAPSFQRLRDVVDFEWMLSSYDSSIETSLSHEELMHHLKLTKMQCLVIMEALQFYHILTQAEKEGKRQINNQNVTEQLEDVSKFKEFRLQVKKGLYRNNAELKHVSKEQMQKELSEMFTLRLQRYFVMISSCRKRSLVK